MSNFGPGAPYGVMDPDRSATITADEATALLRPYVGGVGGRDLRAQLAVRNPRCSPEEIEDAVQAACRCFFEEAEGISEPNQVHVWLRTAAHRILCREGRRQRREVATDPVGAGGLEAIAVEDSGPAEELMALEDDADLETLVRVVFASLPERRRKVFALYATGRSRAQIAERLGLPERIVQYDIGRVVDRARAVLARLAGGGCQSGEPLVLRLLCGLSTPEESAQAREHLSRCARCEGFCERLSAWREKAGAMLPASIAEGASPGVIERAINRSAEGLSSLKQQIINGGVQAKQQMAAGYYRAVDPTPFATARPGAAVAVLASCLAVGGGAAYCVEQGVDPVGAAKGLIATASEGEEPAGAPPSEPTPPAPVYTPAELPGGESPAPETRPPAAEEPPEPEPTPPREDSFEPVTPAYQSSNGEAETLEAPEAAPPEPAPVRPGAGPQFGGP